MSEESSKPHVVIVGGGFAGLNAALSLRRASVQITLIDRANHHLFQPLLYQVATAGLSPADIASPIRSIIGRQKNVEVLLAEVTGVDLQKCIVHVGKTELGYTDIPYDALILATGARTTYYGNDHWSKYAVGLKTVDDALELRRRILLAFEAAERERDTERRKRLTTFVVVGGGPTGVEMAGALAELTRFVLARDFRNVTVQNSRVILIEGGDRVLAAFSEDLSRKAAKRLEGMGVQLHMNSRVSDISAEGVSVGDEFIATATVVWGAGVAASAVTDSLGVERDRAGRVLIAPDCSIPGHSNAFCVGDMAHLVGEDGRILPGVAPVAIQQGRYVAKTALPALFSGEEPPAFRYRNKGNLATIGRKAAIAEIGRLRLSGFLAWVTWLFVHILSLIEFRNRLIVMVHWGWQYLTYQRGARLITGGRLTAGAPRSEADGERSDGLPSSAVASGDIEGKPTTAEKN